MSDKVFRFKQFSVKYDLSPMKIGFDGILLGAWCDIHNDSMVLDVGTGTGLIALMLAQKNPNVEIYAIEPHPDSYMEALFNFKNCSWKNRLSISKIKLQDYNPSVKFDHIVCNPPYFNAGTKSFLKDRAKARHTISLTHEELLIYATGLLHSQGKLSVILPFTEGNEFISRAVKLNFGLSRLYEVFTKSKVERLLIELKYNWSGNPLRKLLKIYDDSGNYSIEYKNVVNDFYLNI